MGILDFSIAPQDMNISPQALDQRRKLAQALQRQGMDYSPVKSAWQGAARVAQALSGAWDERQADKIEAQKQGEYSDKLKNALAGGSSKDIFGLVADPWAPAGAAQALGMYESGQRQDKQLAQAEKFHNDSLGLQRQEFEWRQQNANQPKYEVDPYTGQPVWVDPSRRTVTPADTPPAQPMQPQMGAAQPPATVEVPPPPPGVSPKVWRDTYTRQKAEAAAGKPLTETQSKDVYYLNQGSGAIKQLEEGGLENALKEYGGSIASNIQDEKGMVGSVVAPFANKLKSDQYRQAEQAGRTFVAAVLRKESGAAITPDEWRGYGRLYLPQPGDDDTTIAMKREGRQRAMNGIKAGLPPQATFQHIGILSLEFHVDKLSRPLL